MPHTKRNRLCRSRDYTDQYHWIQTSFPRATSTTMKPAVPCYFPHIMSAAPRDKGRGRERSFRVTKAELGLKTCGMNERKYSASVTRATMRTVKRHMAAQHHTATARRPPQLVQGLLLRVHKDISCFAIYPFGLHEEGRNVGYLGTLYNAVLYNLQMSVALLVDLGAIILIGCIFTFFRRYFLFRRVRMIVY